ncbi:MAG TPA: hypothetical protein VJL29_10580 [Thermoguttaceae bacterium]|nr:hypothetical protein [Thermoguttaceae bacterium]
MTYRTQWWVGFLLMGLAIAAGAAWLTTSRGGSDKKTTGHASLAPPTFDEAIQEASNYLASHCDERGRFTYLVNLDPKIHVVPQYNIIRHAGAVHALALSQRRHPNAETRKALLRAAGFLRRAAVGPVPGETDMITVWSTPEIDGQSSPTDSKLGGAGLGLAALASVEQVVPGTASLEELRGLGRFLTFMQKRDGSFYYAYEPGSVGRNNFGQCLYYPGEAALGLMMLYEMDPQPIWLEAAARAMAYLARLRRGDDVVEPDHWALLATARLWPVCDRCNPPLPREMLLEHAKQICRRMLDDRPDWSKETVRWGCLTHDGRTCPTATRVEGLAAALTFLPDEEAALREEIRRAVGPAVEFLRRSQIRQGPCRGGIPGVVARDKPWAGLLEKPGETTEIRVDYVQHALGGMIEWEKRVGQAVPDNSNP